MIVSLYDASHIGHFMLLEKDGCATTVTYFNPGNTSKHYVNILNGACSMSVQLFTMLASLTLCLLACNASLLRVCVCLLLWP